MSNDSESDDDYGPAPVKADINTEKSKSKRKSTKESTKKQKKETEEVVPVSKKQKIEADKSIPPPEPKRKVVDEWESLYLSQLPSANHYEVSFMHRDIVTHIVVSKVTEFIITGSADGHVKFWKKMTNEIEFVKHYQAHLGKK
jgi:peptidylprolyl isomerase domain and WD repeat-containing protein 1